MPIAAISALCSLISHSPSINTTSELLTLIHAASADLATHSFNPISLNCGTQLFLRFLTLQRPGKSFSRFKEDVVERGMEFVRGSGRCREVIAENLAEFIKDGSVSQTLSYITLLPISIRQDAFFVDFLFLGDNIGYNGSWL